MKEPIKESTKKDSQNQIDNPSKSIKEEESLLTDSSTSDNYKSIANRNAVLSIVKAMTYEDLKITASAIPSEILIAEIFERLMTKEHIINNVENYLKEELHGKH